MLAMLQSWGLTATDPRTPRAGSPPERYCRIGSFRSGAYAPRVTQLARRIAASATSVYEALTTADNVQGWMVPDGMTSVVHEFDARQGGSFRVSLTYDDPRSRGKSNAATDTFHGRFVRLVPGREVVQDVEFETDDPRMQGVMTVRYVLREEDGTTVVLGSHEHMPTGLSPEDNELGWRISMDKLARLVEGRSSE